MNSGVTWSVVAAAALLAEASEQQRHVISQGSAAVLYEEANQLTHLWRETVYGYKENAFLGIPHGWEQFIWTVLHLDRIVILLVFMLRRFVRKLASGDSRRSCLASCRHKVLSKLANVLSKRHTHNEKVEINTVALPGDH